MSTSPEVREELPPGPLEIIGSFEKAHEELISVGQAALSLPSDETIEAIAIRAAALKDAAVPLFEATFFRESQNEMLIDAGVGSLVISGEQLTQVAYDLADVGQHFKSLPPDTRENLSSSIYSGDLSVFVPAIGTEGNDEIPNDEQIVSSLMSAVKSTYYQLIDQYEEMVYDTDSIQEYLQRRQSEMETLMYEAAEKFNRLEKAKLLGSVVAAAFVGAFLANRFQQRR
jgi:hypothetical protein